VARGAGKGGIVAREASWRVESCGIERAGGRRAAAASKGMHVRGAAAARNARKGRMQAMQGRGVCRQCKEGADTGNARKGCMQAMQRWGR
jgi:hypothetical protein